jgi:hypothetical protein
MMTSHSSPRRLLLILAMVAGLAGFALAPRAEARVHPPARPAVGARAGLAGDSFAAALDFVANLLHSVWANAGSSLDPLGNH